MTIKVVSMTPEEIDQLRKNTTRLTKFTIEMQKIQKARRKARLLNMASEASAWEEISGVQNVTAEKLKHIPHRADCHWPHHSAVAALEAYEKAYPKGGKKK